MSVMATNSMTSSGAIPGRVSAVVSHLDELRFDRLQNYANVNSNNDKLDDINMSISSGSASKFQNLGKINDAFEEHEKDIEPDAQGLALAHSSTCTNDDEHVYANLSEIVRHDELEDIDRRPVPPMPSPGMEPIRTMPTGWQEYKTFGGRSYYFHPEKNVCQWKPPRNPKNFLLISQYLQNQHEQQQGRQQPQPQQNHCDPSTSASTEMFAEIPLRNEYDLACCSSDSNEQPIPDGMVSFHSAMLKASEKECDQKGIMSQSVNGALYHRGGSKKGVSYFNNQSNSSPTFYGQPNNASHCPESSTDSNGNGQCIEIILEHPLANNNNNTAQHNTKLMDLSHLEQSVLNAFSQNRFCTAAIRQGTLEKCRLADSGVKLKKKEWSNSYAYLYSSHLLFYKDQKSAEKTGKHYPAPTDVCDLRGAALSYLDTEKQKDKRRKHVISLLLINKTEYLFSCSGNESEINGWFHALRQTISSLPSFVQTYPLPTIMDYGGSLQRGSTRNKTLLSQTSKGGSFGAKSFKSKLRKSGSKESVDALINSDGSSKQGEHHNSLTRESIIERLLRFFRSRPSMESLRERGIYKPEPVFGSTLTAICTHERSVVPRFIAEVTRLIEERGLDMDGLYRVNGNLSSVQKIRCHIDQDKYEALQTEEDVHVLTGSLKLFFRELTEPIFPMGMNRDFMSAIREPNIRQRFKAIDELLLKLPEVNRETLKVLVFHLERVATHSGKNRMQVHNLAIMFGPTLFGTEDRVAANAARKNSNDTKGRNTRRKSTDKKDENLSTQAAEPNQNLAYKMVIYGQIIEFILNESKKLSLFINANSTSC